MVSLGLGLLFTKIKDEVRRPVSSKRRAISCVMDDFPVPASPKKNETTLGSGIVHPINNEVEEGHACSPKTALVWGEARASPIWDFSDFFSSSTDDHQIDYSRAFTTTYQHLTLPTPAHVRMSGR